MLGQFKNTMDPSAGRLLLSEPFLFDSNFRRTVVLLCEYEEEGSLGFILNRPLELTLKEVMDIETDLTIPLYLGGPVERNTLHFIHRPDPALQSSRPLTQDVYWGGDFNELLPLLKNNTLDLDNFRFFLGYSGWGKGQLPDEMEANSWIVAQAQSNAVFENNPDVMWKRVLESMGGTYRMMANYPESPQMN